MTKVRKKWGFLKKSQEIWQNLKKRSDFVRLNYKIPYFPKPSNSKKLIKNPLKIFLEIYKIICLPKPTICKMLIKNSYKSD